jgi:hypothetical protein
MEASYVDLTHGAAENSKKNGSLQASGDLTQDVTDASHVISSSESGSSNSSTNGDLTEQHQNADATTKIDDNLVDATLNQTVGLNELKKNLCNEEEFRSINHQEPIHIFLKLKPITDQESKAQNHMVKNF